MMVRTEGAESRMNGRFCTFPATYGNMLKQNLHIKVTKDGWDSVDFVPVKASAIKIRVKMNKDFSAGIYEWVVD